MNAWEPIVSETAGQAPPPKDDADRPAFEVVRPGPEGDPPPGPVVYASPHSGRHYPKVMLDAARLGPEALCGSEDAYVDDLIADAPAEGVSIIRACLARAYIDLNRDPWELDPSMFEDELPAFARSQTARVAAGLGAIARVAGEGRPIYGRKLTFAEALARIEGAHRPYHDALDRLLAQARAAHGLAVLVDWHSMPAAAARGHRARGGGPCDIVLGDRFGASCSPRLVGWIEATLESRGYRVARNAPYAGGYTTEHYGRPGRRTHAIQVEINRALYMNETTRQPNAGLEALKTDIAGVTAMLRRADWSQLR